MYGIFSQGFVVISASIVIGIVTVIGFEVIELFIQIIVSYTVFSVESGFISIIFKDGRIGIFHIRGSNIARLKVEVMGALVQSGQDAGPASGTYRGRDHGVLEIRAFFRQLVHFWGRNQFVSGIAQGIETLIVGENEDDVGPICLLIVIPYLT